MLNNRVNIMFDHRTWSQLKKIAFARNRTASDLVREAVQDCYLTNVTAQRQKAIKHILAIRPKPVASTIDYKALINEGRRV